jgi:FixJ family two-component response regulator
VVQSAPPRAIMSPLTTSAIEGPVVHVVEDHDSSRKATTRLLQAAGYAARMYASAADFLAEMPAGPGCVVLDLRLPGLSGLDLQDTLARSEDPLPVVFLSGHGDVPKTAQAMKAGAVDFLTKPVNGKALLEAVARALVRDSENRTVRARQQEARTRYERLTPKEREVFAHVISGQLNKQAGFDLGASEHTVKVHRGRVMHKLEADSVADLIRIAADLGISPVGKVR